MLLPFDTTPNYWLMALPEFEWQPEAPEAPEVEEPASLLDASGAGEQMIPDCDDETTAPPAQPTLSAMRLVMTGMRWVVVPVWTPRDNPFWEQMTQISRDTDSVRNDTRSLEPARRHPDTPADDPLDPDRKL